MDSSEQFPETVDEAIAILKDGDGLGALYALCLKAEAENVDEMKIPRTVVTGLILCAMALLAKEVEVMVVNDYQIKKLRQDGTYSIVSPKGEIVAEGLTHEEAWKRVDRLVNETVSRSDNVVDWMFQQTLN